jgi:dienelactone hydrolase
MRFSLTPGARRRRLILISILLVILAAAVIWLWRIFAPEPQLFTESRGALLRADASASILERDGFVGQGVELTSDQGLVVNLRVLRPASAVARLPLVILLGGHRTGRDAVDVLGNPGGMAVAALDYPYHGPERLRGFRQIISRVPEIQRGLLDTPHAVSLALDWLVTQPWVDPSRIELMGVSLGVPFVAVAGANDQRFRRVWLVHGGFNNREWLANRLESRIENDLVRSAAAGLLHGLAHGPSFQTGQWVSKISPRPVVIIGASEDEQMPRESVEKLYDAARAPKELQWSEGGHVRPHRVEIVRQLLAMVRTRILADGESDLVPVSAQ